MSGRFLGLENRTSAHGPDPLPWLRVFPPAVTFADVEANTAYTATVTLRNADTRPHVVKVIPPKTSRFAFAGKGGVTTTRLSPGLTASFDVTFTADEANDFFDACVIQTDAGETAVRLAARAPAPRMAMEGDLDFGVVSPGDALTRTVSVRNAGSAEAEIECTWDRRIDREVFRVEPRFATVEPGKAVELTAYLNPREPGDVSVDVDVAAAPRAFDADARRASATRLCATAVVVPRAPEFLTDAPDAEPLPMRAVDFGHVLCGDTRAVSGAVYNNSPYPATFAVKLRAEDKAARRDLGALAVTPSQGALRPYEKRRVTFTMRPALPPSAANENAAASAKGFKSTENGTGSGEARRGDDGETTPSTRDVRLNATISFDANGPVKSLRLPVHARAVIAALAVDPPELDFGEIAARDRGDHLVTVRNLNDEIPVDFAFARGAFFKPEPSQGRVLPGQTVNVAIAYEPKALGAHADALAVRALGPRRGCGGRRREGDRLRDVADVPRLVPGREVRDERRALPRDARRAHRDALRTSRRRASTSTRLTWRRRRRRAAANAPTRSRASAEAGPHGLHGSPRIAGRSRDGGPVRARRERRERQGRVHAGRGGAQGGAPRGVRGVHPEFPDGAHARGGSGDGRPRGPDQPRVADPVRPEETQGRRGFGRIRARGPRPTWGPRFPARTSLCGSTPRRRERRRGDAWRRAVRGAAERARPGESEDSVLVPAPAEPAAAGGGGGDLHLGRRAAHAARPGARDCGAETRVRARAYSGGDCETLGGAVSAGFRVRGWRVDACEVLRFHQRHRAGGIRAPGASTGHLGGFRGHHRHHLHFLRLRIGPD
jgi:hypothetical protein